LTFVSGLVIAREANRISGRRMNTTAQLSGIIRGVLTQPAGGIVGLVVKGRLKTSHLWAPQNQPVFRCV